MKALFKNWWLVALKGLLLLVLGIFAVTRPAAAIMTLVTYTGIVSLLVGAFLVIAGISNFKRKGSGWTIAEGVFDILFGVIVLTYPFTSSVAAATIFSIFLGFWALFGGFTLIGNAFRYRKVKGSKWGLILVGGILTVICGWVIIANPFANMVALTVLIGMFTIIFGISTIVWAFQLKSIKDKVEEALNHE